jgi:hypothetical protein
LAVLSVASRLLPPAFCASMDCWVTVSWDWARRFWLIRSAGPGFPAPGGRIFDQQVVLAVAQVLQLAVAGQFLAAQRNQRIERGQLGVELVALVGADGLAAVLAGLEDVVDLLGASGWLISAWARSGRVCAVMIRLLASDRAFCSSPCWVSAR